jgi:hypothetical protein
MTRTSNLGLSVVLFGVFILFGIVALITLSQVQDIELPRSVPTIVPGLRPEHHGELNKVLDIPATRYDELRKEYEGNSAAQQQIDVYDPATEYHGKMGEYVEAIRSNNREKITELEDWFKEHYPDIR